MTDNNSPLGYLFWNEAEDGPRSIAFDDLAEILDPPALDRVVGRIAAAGFWNGSISGDATIVINPVALAQYPGCVDWVQKIMAAREGAASNNPKRLAEFMADNGYEKWHVGQGQFCWGRTLPEIPGDVTPPDYILIACDGGMGTTLTSPFWTVERFRFDGDRRYGIYFQLSEVGEAVGLARLLPGDLAPGLSIDSPDELLRHCRPRDGLAARVAAFLDLDDAGE